MKVIIPSVDYGEAGSALIAITKAHHEHTGAELIGGFLGGRYGYGACIDNEVFMMHPFCWCERHDCPWCMARDCDNECSCDPERQPAPNFHHKPSGVKVWWYKYIGRGMQIEGEADWRMIERECLEAINKMEGVE